MGDRADQQFAPQSEMPYFPHVSQGEPIVHGMPSFTPILPPPSPNQVLHSDDSKRRAGIILLIAAGAILLVLLVPTSFILLNGARSNPSTPYPTNTPVQQIVQQSTPPFATSAPTPVQRQLSSQQTQSQTASATGSGTTAATQATGTLKYCDQSLLNTTVNKGTTLSNKEHTVMVVVDATLTTKAGACATGPGHVVQAGSIGNIAAQDMLQFRSGASYITNDQPFSGGQNAQTYAVVQQSDIDGAAGTLTTLTTQTAETNIQQQLHGNEHLVGNPQCTSNVTADHNPGDRVSQVTVTGTTTCTATAST